MITEPNFTILNYFRYFLFWDFRTDMFLELLGLSNKWEQWITESLTELFWVFCSAMSVEELPNLGEVLGWTLPRSPSSKQQTSVRWHWYTNFSSLHDQGKGHYSREEAKGRFRKRVVLANVPESRMRGIEKEGSCNSKFVLKPDVAIASEVSMSSKDSLAITDFLAKKTQLANYCRKPSLLEPAHSRFPKCTLISVFVLGEHANVPLFWFSFRGNIWMCPRSLFLFQGNIRQNHPFENHLFVNPDIVGLVEARGSLVPLYSSLPWMHDLVLHIVRDETLLEITMKHMHKSIRRRL